MLIVLEGLDGAGKSTQLGRLDAMFQRRGLKTHHVHFPRFDAPVYGELIARFLRGELGTVSEVDPYLVAMLFAGDRAAAAPQIARWLDGGDVVLLDRYVYSNVAYQCAKVEGFEEQEKLRKWILDLEFGHYKIPEPNVSLFLDVPFSFTRHNLEKQREGDDRAYLQGKEDIHEASMELQRRVREMYLRCAETDPHFRVVDCGGGDDTAVMGEPDDIFEKIRKEL